MKSLNIYVYNIICDNEPGALARVVNLFSARGYNIRSMSVSPMKHAVDAKEKNRSRIIIVSESEASKILNIQNQICRVVPVHSVAVSQGEERLMQLAFVKVKGLLSPEIKQKLGEKYAYQILKEDCHETILSLHHFYQEVHLLSEYFPELDIMDISYSGVVAMQDKI